MSSPTEIRKGRVLLYQGIPHLVLEMLHRTQGRQAGFVQLTLRNLQTQSSTTAKIRSTDNVQLCHTTTQKLEFSYIDQQGYHFMDTETFEDSILPTAVCEPKRKFLIENAVYEILLVDGEPTAINLPVSIEMEVLEAPEGIRGDTASKVQKAITLQSGLVIQAPLFINPGDKVKVGTTDGSYLGRA